MNNSAIKKELWELASFREPYCLTMYIPYIKPNATKNPQQGIAHNLLIEAEAAFTSVGASTLTAMAIIDKTRDYIENHEVYPTRGESLVIFAHEKLFRAYHIPDEVRQSVVVMTGFNTIPAIKALEAEHKYYVLALSHNTIRLYEGDRLELAPVHLKNLPTNMHDALHVDEYPQSRETHPIAPANTGKTSRAYHSQYNVAQTDKKMLDAFFRLIDKSLHEFLTTHHRPLILAGVKYLLPIYRKVNTYPGLLTQTITGNQEQADVHAIRKKAWKILQEAEGAVA